MAPKPIPITPKDLDQIRVMAGMGLSIEKIALVLGFSQSTFYRRKKLLPEVQKAYDEGSARAEFDVSRTIYDMAVSDRNLTAAIWLEKTRFGRSEKAEIKHEVQTDAPQQQVVVYLPDNGRDDGSKPQIVSDMG